MTNKERILKMVLELLMGRKGKKIKTIVGISNYLSIIILNVNGLRAIINRYKLNN
jgi:hypothetical protein